MLHFQQIAEGRIKGLSTLSRRAAKYGLQHLVPDIDKLKGIWMNYSDKDENQLTELSNTTVQKVIL